MLRFDRKQQNSAKHLSFNLKVNKLKKKPHRETENLSVSSCVLLVGFMTLDKVT